MSDNPNNIYGSIQNMMGGSIGYTRFRPAPGDEIQIGGTLNVITDQGVPGEIQVNGVSISGSAAPNQVDILTLSDFPTPVAGDITLEAKHYLILDNVDIGTNRIVWVTGCSMSGINRGISSLTTNNATSLITSTAVQGLGISMLTLGNTGVGRSVQIDTILGANLRNSFFLSPIETIAGSAGGLRCTGCVFIGDGIIHGVPGMDVMFIDSCLFQDTSAASVLIDFPVGTSASQVVLSNSVMNVAAGGTAIRVNTQGQITNGTVTTNTFTGGGTYTTAVVGTFDQTSDNWEFFENIGIVDSSDKGSSILTAVPTTITMAADTYRTIDDIGVAINWAVGSTPEKFTITDTDTGELTYNGSRDHGFKYGGYLTFNSSGTDKIFKVGVFVNNVIIPESEITIVTGTKTVSAVIPLSTTILVTGDTVVMKVKEVTTAIAIDIQFATLSIAA